MVYLILFIYSNAIFIISSKVKLNKELKINSFTGKQYLIIKLII